MDQPSIRERWTGSTPFPARVRDVARCPADRPGLNRLVPVPSRLAHVVFPRETRRLRVLPHGGTRALPAPTDERTAHLATDESAFLHWLLTQAGVDAGAYRPESLKRRLRPCLRALRVQSVGHGRACLEREPALIRIAVNAVLVGVTALFRDPPVFELLREQVLGPLAGRRERLYIWCLGCSDGSEVYSLALLLDELELLKQSCLLGTDCRVDAIERARVGWFEHPALKDVPPRLVERGFTRQAHGWQARAGLRRAIHWRVADFLKGMEPGLWDLIFFRNTAMYLKPDVTDPLWERLESSLRPGGVLVLGKAERPAGAQRLSLLGPCIYRRTRKQPA